MGRAKELVERQKLGSITNKWLTLSEIGDNNMSISYESSLSVLRPVTEVNVGDICMSNIFYGIVTDVYTGSVDNDLGLKGIKVRYEDPYNQVKGEPRKNKYEDRIFVFGNESLPEGIKSDGSHVCIVDAMHLKIVKRNTETYKDSITQIMELRNKKRSGTVEPPEEVVPPEENGGES